MKMYIAAGMSWFYGGLDSYLRIETECRKREGVQRTKFFCLEDGCSPDGRRNMFYEMMD